MIEMPNYFEELFQRLDPKHPNCLSVDKMDEEGHSVIDNLCEWYKYFYDELTREMGNIGAENFCPPIGLALKMIELLFPQQTNAAISNVTDFNINTVNPMAVNDDNIRVKTHTTERNFWDALRAGYAITSDSALTTHYTGTNYDNYDQAISVTVDTVAIGTNAKPVSPPDDYKSYFYEPDAIVISHGTVTYKTTHPQSSVDDPLVYAVRFPSIVRESYGGDVWYPAAMSASDTVRVEGAMTVRYSLTARTGPDEFITATVALDADDNPIYWNAIESGNIVTYIQVTGWSSGEAPTAAFEVEYVGTIGAGFPDVKILTNGNGCYVPNTDITIRQQWEIEDACDWETYAWLHGAPAGRMTVPYGFGKMYLEDVNGFDGCYYYDTRNEYVKDINEQVYRGFLFTSDSHNATDTFDFIIIDGANAIDNNGLSYAQWLDYKMNFYTWEEIMKIICPEGPYDDWYKGRTDCPEGHLSMFERTMSLAMYNWNHNSIGCSYPSLFGEKWTAEDMLIINPYTGEATGYRVMPYGGYGVPIYRLNSYMKFMPDYLKEHITQDQMAQFVILNIFRQKDFEDAGGVQENLAQYIPITKQYMSNKWPEFNSLGSENGAIIYNP